LIKLTVATLFKASEVLTPDESNTKYTKF